MPLYANGLVFHCRKVTVRSTIHNHSMSIETLYIVGGLGCHVIVCQLKIKEADILRTFLMIV